MDFQYDGKVITTFRIISIYLDIQFVKDVLYSAQFTLGQRLNKLVNAD